VRLFLLLKAPGVTFSAGKQGSCRDVDVENPAKSAMEQIINHRYYRWIDA
jgi:hypothetical protein